jgi:wyosine [tRNA(Phe)-imidazoG37] synthetase (radical SAM superfamily)
MTGEPERESGAKPREPAPGGRGWEKEFGYARNFLNNRFVYVVISARARGLSVGINMNPDKKCSFDCVYCEVNRELPPRDQRLDVPVMVHELQQTLRLALEGRLREAPLYQSLPAELLQLRQVVLSGDGEPTLCPNFGEAVQAVAHLRALGKFPFFKLVLVTNGTGLDSPAVQSGLQLFTPQDEVWAKLDGGTPEYLAKINRPKVALARVLANLLAVGRQRPIIIQSMFPLYHGEEPAAEEIEQYIARLRELREGGARIALVQIYSAMRPTMHPECGHLSLKTLSRIAQSVRAGAGLRAEVY